MKTFFDLFTVLLLVNFGNAQDWDTLSREVQIRLFTPDNYVQMRPEDRFNRDVVWSHGVDVPCRVQQNLQAQVLPPENFDPDLPIKLVSPGFIASTKNEHTNFVNAWMDKTGFEANIILIEWKQLNGFKTNKLYIPLSLLSDLHSGEGFKNDVYTNAANSAIDVGNFIGRCLAALATDNNSRQPPHIHLVGHSLGAHLVGAAGRAFKLATGGNWQVDRVTGLDPAGPGFVNGPVFAAIPWQSQNRLSPNAAAFVDVIHTHGSLSPAVVFGDTKFGDLNPLGHADYYPDGGAFQENCGVLLPISQVKCHHERAFQYYLNSILEPQLFPAWECLTLNQCNTGQVRPGSVDHRPDAFMGEAASEFATAERKMYFTEPNPNVIWTYYGHRYSGPLDRVHEGTHGLIEAVRDGVKSPILGGIITGAVDLLGKLRRHS